MPSLNLPPVGKSFESGLNLVCIERVKKGRICLQEIETITN